MKYGIMKRSGLRLSQLEFQKIIHISVCILNVTKKLHALTSKRNFYACI